MEMEVGAFLNKPNILNQCSSLISVFNSKHVFKDPIEVRRKAKERTYNRQLWFSLSG